MMQVGIFNGYFPYTLEEQARKIRALGFNTVQLDLAFKDIDFSTPESITVEKAKRVRETFRDHDLPICTVSCYTNIVHPDPAERKKRLALRHLRDRHLQHRVGLGGAPAEQDRGGLRGVPQGHQGAGRDGL
jgi:sugar phosphate isomerase/epimerase